MRRKQIRTGTTGAKIGARKLPQQLRSRATADSIREAALQLVRQSGFASLTAARIATRAGVSAGSFYDYFPNKEAVLLDLYESTSSLVVKRMRENLPQILDIPVASAVEQSVTLLLTLYEEHRLILVDLVVEMPELKLADHPLSFENLGHGSILIYLEHRGKHLEPGELETKAYFLEQIIVGCVRRFIGNPPPHVSRSSFISNLTQIITPYMKELQAANRLELRSRRAPPDER